MYIVLTQSLPQKSIQDLHPADRYQMTLACQRLAEFIFGEQVEDEFIDEVNGNLTLWGKNQTAMCTYGMMLGDSLNVDGVAANATVRRAVRKLGSYLTAMAKTPDDGEPWPRWRLDWDVIQAHQRYIKSRGPREHYALLPWYAAAGAPSPVPFAVNWDVYE